MKSKKTISVPEAGRLYYDISPSASYRAAWRGEIPTMRVGGKLRVPIDAMEAVLLAVGAPMIERLRNQDHQPPVKKTKRKAKPKKVKALRLVSGE